MKTIYFAYGSNMDFEQLNEREIKFDLIGKGILTNYKLCFNKQANGSLIKGYANITYDLNSEVEGLLFEIENIEDLDWHEGFPTHYKKEMVEIIFDGKPIQALVYIANENKIKSGLKPTKDYLSHLL